MSHSHSITELIERLQADESAAEKEIWSRCISVLVARARDQLRQLPRRAVDEEDVALEAFDAFLRGVKEQRFDRLTSREDLWQILAMLTERKAIAVIRRELAQKRGGGKIRGESVFEHPQGSGSLVPGLDGCSEPTTATLDLFTLEVRELLEALDNELLRRLAIGKLAGYTNQELSQQLGIAERSVERKLSLIRQQWEQTSQKP